MFTPRINEEVLSLYPNPYSGLTSLERQTLKDAKGVIKHNEDADVTEITNRICGPEKNASWWTVNRKLQNIATKLSNNKNISKMSTYKGKGEKWIFHKNGAAAICNEDRLTNFLQKVLITNQEYSKLDTMNIIQEYLLPDHEENYIGKWIGLMITKGVLKQETRVNANGDKETFLFVQLNPVPLLDPVALVEPIRNVNDGIIHNLYEQIAQLKQSIITQKQQIDTLENKAEEVKDLIGLLQ